MNRIIESLVILLSGVFLFSAATKIINPNFFVTFLNSLFGIGAHYGKQFLYFLVILEVAVSIGIHFKKVRVYCNYIILAIVVFGLVFDFLAFIWDIKDSCGCFGSLLVAEEIGKTAVIKVMIMISSIFLLLPRNRI